MPRSLILGIDPGIAVTGYGVIEVDGRTTRLLDSGAWKLPQSKPLPEKLHRLHDSISTLLRDHISPDISIEVAVEDFFVGHVRAAVTIGQARAMALLAAAQADLPVFLYSPLEVKQFVTSYGRGDKAQVQEMVRVLLGLAEAPQPADAADALAVAICHSLRRDSAAVLKGAR
ncbi:MAG TPA: crossover junction endodeoxyribonuclease RuvC [Dehalococcoidia bacterium]|nr:crossover junction endodeoxyribonuclease RuvC [Dehalococcoidia bacterium]